MIKRDEVNGEEIRLLVNQETKLCRTQTRNRNMEKRKDN